MHRKYALLIFILQMRAIKLAKFKCLLLGAHTFPPAIHKMQEELEWLTTALGRSSEVSFGWRCFLSTSWSLDPSTLQVCHWSAGTGLRTYMEVLRDPPPSRAWRSQHFLGTISSLCASCSLQWKITLNSRFPGSGMGWGNCLWPDIVWS